MTETLSAIFLTAGFWLDSVVLFGSFLTAGAMLGAMATHLFRVKDSGSMPALITFSLNLLVVISAIIDLM